MSLLTRLGSFLSGGATSASASDFSSTQPFQFQWIELGKTACLKLGTTLPDGRPACDAHDLARGLADLTDLTKQLSPSNPELACIIVNFLPSIMPPPQTASAGVAAPAAVSSAAAACGDGNAATALLSSFGTMLPPIDEGSAHAPFDRLEKLISFCASTTLYTQQRNDRVVLLVFVDESPHFVEYIDYSLLAVTSLLMFQGKLQFLDASDAIDAVRTQYGLEASRRHAASHRTLLKKFRTLFQIPSFPGAARDGTSLALLRVALTMPKNTPQAIRGLRFVVESRGEVLASTDDEWVQSSSSLKELVLTLAPPASSAASPSSVAAAPTIFGDAVLTLYRVDQQTPQMLLRTCINTLFVGKSGLGAAGFKIHSTDMDLEPIFDSASSQQQHFVPDSMTLFLQPVAEAGGGKRTKQQQAATAAELLKTLDLAELKKMYDEVAELAPEQANDVIAEAASSPTRQRTGSVVNMLNASFSSNPNLSFSGRGGKKASTETETSTQQKQQQGKENNTSTSSGAFADFSSPVGSGSSSTQPQHQKSSISAAAAAEPQSQQTGSSHISAFLRREAESGGALGAALGEFAVLCHNAPNTGGAGSIEQHQLRSFTATLGRPSVVAYLSKNLSTGGGGGSSASVVHSSSSSSYGFGATGGTAAGVMSPGGGPAKKAFAVVPKSNWQPAGKRCQHVDCGIEFGLFSFGSKNCAACGLYCCSSCVSNRVALPGTEEYERGEEAAVCPRCLERWEKFQRSQMAAARREQHQHHHAAGRTSTPPPPQSSSATSSAAATPAKQQQQPQASSALGGVNTSSPVPGWAKVAAGGQQQQQQASAAAAVVNIRVAKREKWQPVDKTPRCQSQDGCSTTFGWFTKGSNCYSCGLVLCSAHIYCKTELPPTYREPVPVCARCFSSSEMIKKQASHAARNTNNNSSANGKTAASCFSSGPAGAVASSVVAAETLKQVPDMCLSREVSPQQQQQKQQQQDQQPHAATSSSTLQQQARTRSAGANGKGALLSPGKQLQRTTSGGNWLQQLNREQQQQKAAAAAVPSSSSGDSSDAREQPVPQPSGGDDEMKQRAQTEPVPSTQQRHDVAVGETPVVSKPPTHADPAAAVSVASTAAEDNSQQQQQRPPPPAGNPLLAELHAKTAQKSSSTTAAPGAAADTKPPNPFGGGGGMAGLMAELQSKKKPVGDDNTSAAKIEETKPPQQPAVAAEPTPKAVVDENKPPAAADDDGKMKIYGKTGGKFRPPLTNFPPLEKGLIPIPGKQQEEESQVLYGKTNGSFRPPLTNFPPLKKGIIPVPGKQQPEEEQQQEQQPKILYGKTNGSFRPQLTNFPPLKPGLIPIPGPESGDSPTESSAAAAATAAGAPPASAPKPMNAAQAMMAALLAKKMPNSPTSPKGPASPTSPKKKMPVGPKLKTVVLKKLGAERLRRSALWTVDSGGKKDSASGGSQTLSSFAPKAQEELIRAHFEKKAAADKAAAAAGAGGAAATKKGKKSNAVTSQRQQNIGITLKKLRLSPDELCSRIKNCQLEPDDVEAVKKILPLDEELRNIKHEKSDWGQDGYQWGEVEEFIYAVATKVPDSRERLMLWQLANGIPNSIAQAEKQLDVLQEVVASITAFEEDASSSSSSSSTAAATDPTGSSATESSSPPSSPTKKQREKVPPSRISAHLVAMFHALLRVVNCINQGTAGGNANGFSLESLATLCGTKSVDGKYTLLEVVFEHFGAEQIESMASSFEQLAMILPAAASNPVPAIATLVSTIANSVQRLKKVASQAGGQQQQQKEEDRLVSLMVEAHGKYSGPAADLLMRLQECKDSVCLALEFLGEDRAGDDAQVYNQLGGFCIEFKKAHAAWRLKKELAEKKMKKDAEKKKKQEEAEEKQQQQQKQELKETATTADGENEEDVSPGPKNLRPTPQRKTKSTADDDDASPCRSEEPGWEATPAALFSRVPARRQMKMDDVWDD